MQQMYHQALRFRSITLDRDDSRPAPYILAGRKMYVLGTIDGAFCPIGDEHLAGEMGGVWAHPVRFADGWFVNIYDDHGKTCLDNCHDFEGHLSDVQFRFSHQGLQITRVDFVAEEETACFGLLEVRNTGTETWQGKLGFEARLRMRPSWFSGWETGTTRLQNEHKVIVAYDDHWQGQWGLAFGSATEPDEVILDGEGERPAAELCYAVELAPGATQSWEFLLAVDHQNGYHGALHLRERLTGQGASLLTAKRALYEQIAGSGVTLEVPDAEIVNEYELAKINLHMLFADYGPYLPGYFLAGVPEYPQLFGCDTAYSIAGATAAGFAAMARSSLSILGDYARRAAGRIPHEITTNGRIFHPGNTQETPQVALAVWDYVRWTGDLAFLRLMYPVCREGVMDYVPSLWDGDHDGYPMGDAMVERTGMGSLKLDSACYLYAAWFALAEMASALERPEAESYHLRAAAWRERFERDWWIEDQHLYADSLHSDLRPQLDGHWTQVVPVQLGISSPEHARLVLDEIERSYVNEFGLVHTCGREARVWTLPTGLLALADLRWGRLDQAITQLHNIARTTRHGMLGSFEELIPEGLCFMQLWSAAIYVQGVVEGLLGLAPRAHKHCLRLWPHLPSNWPSATLRDLRIGDHRLMLEVSHTATTISHSQGPEPLHVEHVVGSSAIEAITVYGAPPTRASWERQGEHSAIFFTVEPGHTVTLRHGTGNKMVVEYADDQSDSSGREAATRINASRPDFQPGSDQSG